MNKKCVICGFDKKVDEHHLQKVLEFGEDSEENKVFLCPNHHWIADFGDELDQQILLKKIKEITGKEPLINYKKKEYYERLIKESVFERTGNKKYKDTFDYDFYRKILLSRPNSLSYNFRYETLKKLEINFIISKLKRILDNEKTKR